MNDWEQIDSIEIPDEVLEILSRATLTQINWVHAMFFCGNNREATKMIGIHEKTPYNWDCYSELSRALEILKREAALGGIKATIFHLRQLGPEIVSALRRGITHKNTNTAISAVKETRAWVLPDRLQLTGGIKVDSAFEEALGRAYSESGFEILDEPSTVPDNGKAVRVSSRPD